MRQIALLTQNARYALLFIGASVVSAVGVALPSAWALVPLGFGICIYVLWYKTQKLSTALLLGLVFGFTTSAAGIWWFWDTPPLGWLAVTDPLIEFYAVGAIWSTVALSMGLACMLGMGLIWFVRTNYFAPIIAAVIWALTEEARMVFFSVYTMGDHSLVGPHFSVAALGLTLAENHYLLQLASFGGLMVLNFCIALMAGAGAALVYSIHQQTLSRMSAALLALVLLAPLVAIQKPISQEPLRVALIGDSVMPNLEQDQHRGVNNLATVGALTPLPDVVVFPEGQNIWGEDHQMHLSKTRMFGNHEALILNSNYQAWKRSELPGQPSDTTSRAELAYWSTTRGLLDTYEKVFLMPHGEYAPYTTSWLLSLSHDDSVAKYLKRIGSMIPGNKVVSVPFKGYTIGGLLCSDGLSPRLFQKLAQEQGATVLVDLSNYGWFHGSHTLSDKTIQIGKVQAVSARAWFFQSGNLAPAFAINPQGELIGKTAWNIPQILVVSVPEGTTEVSSLTNP